MKFIVNFVNYKGNYVVSIDRYKFGIKQLKEIKKYLNLPNLDVDLVDNIIPTTNILNVKLEIQEIVADCSNLFMDTDNVDIYVDGGSLNKYMIKEIYVINRYSKNDGIREVGINLKLSKEKLLEDWIKAGYPTEWKI